MTDEHRETQASEWVVAGASTLLVLTAIGFLVYDAVTAPPTPADIRVAVDSVIAGQASYIAHFTAHNVGGRTGAGVQVSGELRSASEAAAVERSEARLDFVPAGSRRQGGLYFSHDPRRYRVVVHAEGYGTP